MDKSSDFIDSFFGENDTNNEKKQNELDCDEELEWTDDENNKKNNNSRKNNNNTDNMKGFYLFNFLFF